jgi:hypothetical protein
MTKTFHGPSDEAIERLIGALDSLVDGEGAMDQLIAIGPRAAPFLERFLVKSPPRSLSLPRCRAVRALGALYAFSSLIKYLRDYVPPSDSVVLFAEDAVRSAAGRELMQYENPGTFQVLRAAVQQRATSGLVNALAQYRWPESVPVLFQILEDDFCREDAKAGLRLVPEAAKPYAILLLRGATPLAIDGPAALHRLRATLELLTEFGIQMNEWPELRRFLEHEDRDCVLSAATLGLSFAPVKERPAIVRAVIDASKNMNWAQETLVTDLLDKWPQVARGVAREIYIQHKGQGEKPNWSSPFWRILHHLLGNELPGKQHDAA